MEISTQTKSDKMVKLNFEAVPSGTRAEIESGVNLLIDGYLVSEDRTIKLPMIRTMSDYKWELNCLIDRLFNPLKYGTEEDVQEDINHIVNCLVGISPEESQEEIRQEANSLIEYVQNLSEDMKPAARIALEEQLKTFE